MHMNYEGQLSFKKDQVNNAFVCIGKFEEEEIDKLLELVIGMEDPYHYRNKVQVPYGISNRKTIWGFF